MNEPVAIVTGAGKGIGEAIAVELARQGASVVLAARTAADIERVADAIRADGGKALSVPTDVTSPDSARRLIERALQRFGHLDTLVNNAGSAVFNTVAESDPEDWWRTVEVNLRGTYLCTRFALPTLLSQQSGHIVNILSVAAETVFSSSSAYCAAKAGALMFTRVLASEVRGRGVRVTAILPGATRTPFWDTMTFHPDPSEMIPPERIAETVAFVVAQKEGVVTDEIHLLPRLGIL